MNWHITNKNTIIIKFVIFYSYIKFIVILNLDFIDSSKNLLNYKIKNYNYNYKVNKFNNLYILKIFLCLL